MKPNLKKQTVVRYKKLCMELLKSIECGSLLGHKHDKKCYIVLDIKQSPYFSVSIIEVSKIGGRPSSICYYDFQDCGGDFFLI